jgi:hypothetical protein
MPSSTSGYTTPTFWERLWRTSGLQFVGLFIIASVIYGSQPQAGASADALVAFYHGERTRILIAAFLSGLNLLNLLWFTAALRTTLAELGQDGWGAAATAALAYSIAGPDNPILTSGLNDFAWILVVLTSFPARC